MTYALLVVIALQAVTLALAIGAAVYFVRWRFDARRMADVLAADLLERYGADVVDLSEKGIKDAARRQYIQIAASFGLPSGPADEIADNVWRRIDAARAEAPQQDGIPTLYE